MKYAIKTIAAYAITTGASGLFAQQNSAPALQNVVQLSASGSVEVELDLLSISLSTTRDGVDANGVQSQLKMAIDTALTEARKTALPGQMAVRTGKFPK